MLLPCSFMTLVLTTTNVCRTHVKIREKSLLAMFQQALVTKKSRISSQRERQ